MGVGTAFASRLVITEDGEITVKLMAGSSSDNKIRRDWHKLTPSPKDKEGDCDANDR